MDNLVPTIPGKDYVICYLRKLYNGKNKEYVCMYTNIGGGTSGDPFSVTELLMQYMPRVMYWTDREKQYVSLHILDR